MADGGGDPRLEAAARVRELAHALTAHDADDETLRRTAAAAEEASRALGGFPRRERIVPTFGEVDALDLGSRGRHPMDDRAIAGVANPMAVDFTAREEDGEIVAEATFGPAFEGAPGRVHGGMVAAVFDDLAGFVLGMVKKPGFTGTLTIRYKAPVPTERPVELRARLKGEEKRKLYVECDARLGDKILATAEGTFILVDPDRWSQHAHELLED